MARTFHTGAFLLALAALALAGCNRPPASPPASKDISVPAGEIGSPLPVFVVRNFDGRDISSADLKGKVVLVDFWATWCQPCKKEMPAYQKFADTYGPRGFLVIGFKLDDMPDTEAPLRFTRRIGVRYPLAVASEELRRKFGGIQGLPTTLLYDRRGKLVKKVIGFEYPQVFESALKLLL